MNNQQPNRNPYVVVSEPEQKAEAPLPEGPGKGFGPYREVTPEETKASVMRATTPQPSEYEKYRQLSARQLGEKAVEAAPVEAQQFVQFAKDVASDPVTFGKNYLRMMRNLGAKAYGEAGWELSPELKKESEETWRAVSEPYKEYFRPGGIQKAIATRPISVAMDVAMPFTLGATALANVAPKTATALKAASMIDPVRASVETAKLLGKGAMKTQQGLLSGLSNVPMAALDTSSKVFDGASPEQRSAFFSSMRGELTADQIQMAVQKALDAKRAAEIGKIKADKKGLGFDQPGSINDFSLIDNEILALEKRFAPAGKVSRFPEAESAINEMKQLIAAYKADPNFQTLERVDELRDALWDIRGRLGTSDAARKSIDSIYHKVKETIDSATGNTKYSDLMDEARSNMRKVAEITQSFGLRAGAGSSIARMLKQQKKGRGVDLLSELSEYDERLPFMLAGDAGREFFPETARQTFVLGGLGVGAAALPAYLGHAVAGALASAPKVATGANVALGGLGNLARKATSNPVQRMAYLTMLSQIPQTQITPETQQYVIEDLKPLIANIESAGSGGYSAVGPKFTHKVRGEPYENQPFGKYQVLKSNLPEWTRKYYGQELTPEEFLKNPEAQERVFEGAMGDALNRYGNARDAVAWWHSGSPLSEAKKRNATDVLGTTTEDYVNKVMQGAGLEKASGGRIERKSGGRVDNVERLVGSLMTRVKQAKRETVKATEPLLDQPDESIVKALDVAQQAI